MTGIVSTALFSFAHKSQPHIECIFSHGIADTGAQVQKYIQYPGNRHYTNQFYTIEAPVWTFNYPDATRRFWRVNFWQTSFGQYNEMEKLRKTLQDRRVFYCGTSVPINFVLYGVSRGASALINLVGTIYKHNKTGCADIRALVLESPFDHVRSVACAVTHKLYLSRFPYMSSVVHFAMSALFRLYREKGVSPLYSAKTIPHEIPILIICSKEDTLVPWDSSYRLYEILRKVGHKNTHILIMDTGKHADLSCEIYHETVHAFYKHYGLPHNSPAALRGKQRFLLCQPTAL